MCVIVGDPFKKAAFWSKEIGEYIPQGLGFSIYVQFGKCLNLFMCYISPARNHACKIGLFDRIVFAYKLDCLLDIDFVGVRFSGFSESMPHSVQSLFSLFYLAFRHTHCTPGEIVFGTSSVIIITNDVKGIY